MVMEWQREGVSWGAQVFIEPPRCLWPLLLPYPAVFWCLLLMYSPAEKALLSMYCRSWAKPSTGLSSLEDTV